MHTKVKARHCNQNAQTACAHSDSYLTRLQLMQRAVDSQIRQMAQQNSRRHAGLVSFSNEVCLVGDGSHPAVNISGDLLNDKEGIRASVRESLNIKDQPISSSSQRLSEMVFGLKAFGVTALGPALLSAIVLASDRAGSRVILCTDGLANRGIGSFQHQATEAAIAATEQFYLYLAESAKEAGVIVSVISIEGQQCKLENFGAIADITGGNVTKVNPLDLTENLTQMLEKPVIATNVTVSVQLHSGFFFRNEERVSSIANRAIGSVDEDSEVTFEFTVKTEFLQRLQAQSSAASKQKNWQADATIVGQRDDAGSLSADASIAASIPTELPFQMKIHYTKPNVTKCLRVLTMMKPLSHLIALKLNEMRRFPY